MTPEEFHRIYYEAAKAADPHHFAEHAYENGAIVEEYTFETFRNCLWGTTVWPVVQSVLIERHHPFCNFPRGPLGESGCLCTVMNGEELDNVIAILRKIRDKAWQYQRQHHHFSTIESMAVEALAKMGINDVDAPNPRTPNWWVR